MHVSIHSSLLVLGVAAWLCPRPPAAIFFFPASPPHSLAFAIILPRRSRLRRCSVVSSSPLLLLQQLRRRKNFKDSNSPPPPRVGPCVRPSHPRFRCHTKGKGTTTLCHSRTKGTATRAWSCGLLAGENGRVTNRTKRYYTAQRPWHITQRRHFTCAQPIFLLSLLLFASSLCFFFLRHLLLLFF